MEEREDGGDCWEYVLRRSDAENRLADAVMARWAYEEECGRSAKEKELKGRGQGICKEGKVESEEKGVQVRGRKRKEKEKTGQEMWNWISERKDVRERKKSIAEGKKMVKEGKMKTIDMYYK